MKSSDLTTDGYYWCSHEVMCWLAPDESYEKGWSIVQVSGRIIDGIGSDVGIALADIPDYVEFMGPLEPPI